MIRLAKDQELLDEITDCNVKMNSNGGSRKIHKQGTWLGVGQSYLDDKSLTNIISQSEAIKRGCHVTFDSEKEKSFIVKDQEGRTVKYPCDSRGLYVRETLIPVDCHVSYVLATSVEGYTDREVGRAARA